MPVGAGRPFPDPYFQDQVGEDEGGHDKSGVNEQFHFFAGVIRGDAIRCEESRQKPGCKPGHPQDKITVEKPDTCFLVLDLFAEGGRLPRPFVFLAGGRKSIILVIAPCGIFHVICQGPRRQLVDEGYPAIPADIRRIIIFGPAARTVLYRHEDIIP
jgi:hypothetical protein